MRTISNSAITSAALSAAFSDAVRYRVVEAAEASEVQEEVQAILDAQAAENVAGPSLYVLTHVDLAGAGDGHAFTARLMFADITSAQVVPGTEGLDPAVARVFCYLASEESALQIAREALDPAIAALDDIVGVTAVGFLQTMLAGASQGTRFMGMELTTLLGTAPTIASAVLSAGPDLLTITGTGLLNTIPGTETFLVISLAGGTQIVLSASDITGGGGTVTALSIVIPAALIPGVLAGDSVTVYVNGRTVSSAIT